MIPDNLVAMLLEAGFVETRREQSAAFGDWFVDVTNQRIDVQLVQDRGVQDVLVRRHSRTGDAAWQMSGPQRVSMAESVFSLLRNLGEHVERLDPPRSRRPW